MTVGLLRSPVKRLQGFDEQPHLQVLKEMLTHTFAVPKRHNKSKPFFDHVISFAVLDNRIWIRNYQVPHAPLSIWWKCQDTDLPQQMTHAPIISQAGPSLINYRHTLLSGCVSSGQAEGGPAECQPCGSGAPLLSQPHQDLCRQLWRASAVRKPRLCVSQPGTLSPF